MRGVNSATIGSLAVLPFQDESGDTDAGFLGDGIAESVINRLITIRDLHVVSRNTAFRYRDRESGLDDVARDLGVRAILTGRVIKRGDHMVISASLEDTQAEKQLWGDRFETGLGKILEVEAQIADQIVSALRLELTGEQRTQLAQSATSNSEAHLAYLEGRFWYHKQTMKTYRKAIEFFNKAINADPQYVLAYVGLFQLHSGMASWGEKKGFKDGGAGGNRTHE